jgi:ATP-dependent DNA ligase
VEQPASLIGALNSPHASRGIVVVGWTDPEGSRPWLGALLLAYYDPDGRLVYAGRAGTGIKQAELERLWQRLQPLSISQMPLAVPPPRDSRFGSPLVLSRVHWVQPELVAEVKFLTWTDDNLLPRSSMKGCAKTSRRARCGATCIRTDNWNPDAHPPIIGRMGHTLPYEFGNVQCAV